jgi:heme exporter protein D
MMPDLGKYEVAVLGSYAVGLALLAVIVILSVVRSRRVKRALDAAEARAKHV